MIVNDRTRWAVVVVALAAGIVAAGHIGKAPAAVPGIRSELGLSMVAAGWVVSMFNGLGSLVGVVFGMVGDLFGHRRFASIGFLALVVGGVLGGLAWNETPLLIGRSLEGIGFIAVVVSAPGLIMAATAAKDRRFAFGLLGIYMPSGAALALALAPFAIAAVGWRGLWMATAAVATAMALLLAVLTRDLPRLPKPVHSFGETVAELSITLARPGLWWLAIAFGAYTLQWTSLMVWLPSFLIESRQTSALVAAELTALVVAANVPGGLLGAWLSHRGIPRWCLVVGANVTMGLCALGIFSDALGDGVRFALCLVFSGVGGILPSGVLGGAAVHAPTPRQIGAANGMVIQGSNVGQFVGPAAVAALISAAGDWRAASILMVASAAFGAAAGVAAAVCERRLPSGHG